MKFLNKISMKIQKFMYVRNGLDYLNQVLTILYTIALILCIFMPNTTSAYICIAFAAVFAVLFIFRTFSKNLPKRRAENEKMYRIRDKIKKEYRLIKNKWRDRKTHKYKKCPKCKAVLRMKKTKGTHKCNCPHCGTEITVKI